MSDLVAYGARCSWWGDRDEAGTKEIEGSKLPCCPFCKGMLFQMPVERWKKAVANRAEYERGYHDLIGFMKGKCFPTIEAARDAYRVNLNTGRNE